MPGRNGTGPNGEGPMTGGGFGDCASDVRDVRGLGRGGFGRLGLGRRTRVGRGVWGLGRGFRGRGGSL